jgi:hypothetical protein
MESLVPKNATAIHFWATHSELFYVHGKSSPQKCHNNSFLGHTLPIHFWATHSELFYVFFFGGVLLLLLYHPQSGWN